MFPAGVPGVPQGVPPDMVKGYQPPPEAPPPVVEAKPREGEAEEDRRGAAQAAAPAAPQPQDSRRAADAAGAGRATTTTQPVQQGSGQMQTMPGAQPTWPTDAPARAAALVCSANCGYREPRVARGVTDSIFP